MLTRTNCSALNCLLVLCLACHSISAFAGDPQAVLPMDERDAAIQSPEQFFGFPIGSRHLRHDQVTAYWKYLAESSDRVTLLPYGETHLVVAAITSAQHAAELSTIEQQRPQLASGEFSGDLQQQLLVMYMGYCVHGDEASAVNAAPLVAYHLASSNSAEVLAWLEKSIFLVDPALNPDGVDRFANWANETRGRFASDSSIDREHVQPWPGGRTNYYWFDLNRDLLPAVHPESQGRLALFSKWQPNVVLDFHEMGGSSTYFFQPGIPARNNPFTPEKNLELTRKFAAEHAKSMDAAGELYFTEERFDDFYPGKGSTYPDLHGAVGILFEQGSTRGLKLKNETTDRHFRDTVANQVRTSLSSLRAAHEHRDELLELQSSFYASALEQGKSDTTTAYVLTGSPSRIEAAARLLNLHSIKAYQPTSNILLAGAQYESANVLVIPTAQAEYQFIRSLMEPLQSFRENIFYDVSTWHLPSAFDLDMHLHQNDLPEGWLANLWRDTSDEAAGRMVEAADETLAGFAFSPVELDAPRLVVALQTVDAKIYVATKPFVCQNERWPIGTFLVLKQPNQSRWQQISDVIANSALGVSVRPLRSGLTEVGPDLGSNTTLVLPKSAPLLIVGRGTNANEAGALWHFLDHRMEQPATLVDAEDIAAADLKEFTCVILPGGSYSQWGAGQVDSLRSYLRSGGTLIATTSSVNWLRRVELLSKGESLTPQPTIVDESGASSKAFGDADDDRALESIAGAFFNVQLDPTHPLAYGFPDDQVPVFRDHTNRFPLPANSYQVAATYTGVIAGYVSQRNRTRLADSAAVWSEPVGRGRVILLADNPVFRGYVRASERFLTNAILLGPVLDIPSPPITGNAAVEGDDDH